MIHPFVLLASEASSLLLGVIGFGVFAGCQMIRRFSKKAIQPGTPEIVGRENESAVELANVEHRLAA